MRVLLLLITICCIGQVVLSCSFCCCCDDSGSEKRQRSQSLEESLLGSSQGRYNLVGTYQDVSQVAYDHKNVKSMRSEYAKVFITAEGDVEGAALLQNNDWSKVELEYPQKGTPEWRLFIAYYGGNPNL